MQSSLFYPGNEPDANSPVGNLLDRFHAVGIFTWKPGGLCCLGSTPGDISTRTSPDIAVGEVLELLRDESLKDRKNASPDYVVLVAEPSVEGGQQCLALASLLHTHKIPVRVLNLKVSIDNWVRQGGTQAELELLAEQSPYWEMGDSALCWDGITPRSLVPELLPVPEFKPEWLPSAFRDYVVDSALRMGSPIDFVAVSLIVSLSALVALKVGIRPKAYDNWTVTVNQYGMLVSLTGSNKKSPSMKAGVCHLERLEWESLELYRRAYSEWEGQDRKERGPEPVRRRYMTTDATTESLIDLSAKNEMGGYANAILDCQDELMSLFDSFKKKGRESDRKIYLKFFNGDASHLNDRIGRGNDTVQDMCLSILGGIQPGPLAYYFQEAQRGGGADGFIQRFQLAVCPDKPAHYRGMDRPPDIEAKNKVWGAFTRLAQKSPEELGATTKGLGFRERPYVRFESVAQPVFDRWLSDLQDRIHNETDTPVILGYLHKYPRLVPSLALLFHLADGGQGEVPLHQLKRAIEWASYLEAHTKRLYQYAMDADTGAAESLVERLRTSLPCPFTTSYVLHKGWGGLKKAEDVTRACEILEERGWIQSVKIPSGSEGGRPKTEYYIHPVILAERQNKKAEKNRNNQNNSTQEVINDFAPPEPCDASDNPFAGEPYESPQSDWGIRASDGGVLL